MIRCLIPKNCQLELVIEMKTEFKLDNFWEIRPSSSVLLYRVVPGTMIWFPTTILVAIATFRSSLNGLDLSIFNVVHSRLKAVGLLQSNYETNTGPFIAVKV